MAEHGLTTADIDSHTGGKKRSRKPGVKAAVKSSGSAAKYRDPKTGATWSGRGRAPAWIASAKDRSKFLVEANAVSSAPAAKKSAKAGNYVRGSQPALYRDPKTGVTWSGRGRAPAWIAGVKDRTRFSIAGDAVATAAPSAGSVSSRRTASTKKASPTRKAVPAKKATIVKKPTAGKKAVPARKLAVKRVVVKKVAVKKAAPAKKVAAKKVPAKKAVISHRHTPARPSAKGHGNGGGKP